MKASISLEDLNKGLSVVTKVVVGRTGLPVLSNVLVEAEEEGLTISAANMEMGMRMAVGGKVTERGAIAVPAKNLAELVGTLPAGVVSLEQTGDKLKVGTGRSGAVFAGIAASEFPVMPRLKDKVKNTARMRLDKKIIWQIGKQVAFAAAADESRPVLTGIQFKREENKLIVTATDGFRLSRKVFESEKSEVGRGWGEELILPAKAVIELARVVGEGKKTEVEMEMVEESNQVVFGYDRLQLVSRVLGGNFPDVDKIIPTEHKTAVLMDREELAAAVRAAAIFARDNSNIVRLAIEKDKVKVSAVAQVLGESLTEIEADVEGEDEQISFNYRYLQEYLGSTEDERVKFLTNGAMVPGVWRGEKEENTIHLIMPVRV